MHLNDLHRHLDTLAGTPQSVPTWRSLVEALKSQQLLSILVHSSDQDKREIAIKLYDIVDAHDLGLQEAFFGVDHIKSIIENETITAVGNKIELYLKRHALPTEDTTTGTPKPSRKERWANRRNRNKKDDDEPLLDNAEPKKSRRERLEEAVAPVVEERRKTFGKQQEAEPHLSAIDLDEDHTTTPNTTKGPSRRTTFREKQAAQCSALRASVNNRIDGLKTRKNNLVDAAKKNFNEFGQKSKKALDTFRNGPDFDDFTMEEQGQIGLLGDYAKDFLEDPAHAGQNLTDLMLCDYAKSQRHISFRKAYQYLLTLQKAGILTISRYRGIIEMAGVTRPQKVVRDMNNDLTSLESYLIIQLNARKAPTYNELWTWFVDERYGGKDKQPRGLFNDEKLLFSELLHQLVKEGFIITRGRGDKTTYHKGPKFRTHTVAPAQTSHASDNEALDVVYALMDTKTLQLETRVYTEVLQALKKILENHTKTPTLNRTQLTLLTDAIQLYATQADQLNQINPYTLLTLFDEIDAPIPPLLWEWKNTLEKTYIDHIRQEEVIAQQPRIKAHLLSQFTSNTLRDKLATKYIVVAYEEDDIPASLKSLLITIILPYFRECALDKVTHVYDKAKVTDDIDQAIDQDINKELVRAGIFMPDAVTSLEQGVVKETSGTTLQPAELFVQALTLKKNATEQEEFIDELAYPDMHLAHLQKKPATTKIDYGTGWKGIKGKFSTAVSNAFADDTPTAKQKEYKDTLSETYLEHCTPHLYTRTINRNENVQIDQETGTITYMLHGHQTSCTVDRKKPEEAMSRIAMDSSNGRNDEEKAKIIKALLKSYAENLFETDGPQKFINKAGQPCILTVETRGKIVIYIDGTKQEEPFVNGSEDTYEDLLGFRSHISSAMEQFIPLDQRLHADKKAATGSVSLPSRSAERNAFNRWQKLSTRELAITTGKIITTPASTKKVRDSSAEGGYREEPVPAKDRDANIILIPAGDELLDKTNAGQHIFTLPGNITTFWKERTFIRFAEKIIEVKYIDTLANQKRYEVIAEWDSREKVYDNVDMNALLNKEIERMGNDQAIADMQPLVSFIIPEQHGTDAAQVYYFNPATQERFKGKDKDGHPGVSDRDLGDFATDIRSGNVLERGPELKVRVQAFATANKGYMNGNRFERRRTGKNPNTLNRRKLKDAQIPRVLKESLHAKKAINDALAACLARLS